MYIIKSEFSFDSAHFLKGYDGPCKHIHGHRWRVIARIKKMSLKATGNERDMVVDFGIFKKHLKEIEKSLDHAFIYEKDSLKPETIDQLKLECFNLVEFPYRPTAERLAQHFFYLLRGQYLYDVVDVEVYETPNNSVIFYEGVN